MSARNLVADVSTDWMTQILIGLGVTASGQEYIGGLLLACAGATIARGERKKGWFTTLLTAVIVATVGIELLPLWFPELEAKIPVPAAMCVLGFVSRFLVTLALKILTRAEAAQDQLADIILGKITRLLGAPSVPVDRDQDK